MQTAAMLHGNVNAVLARESFQVKIKKEIAGFQVEGTGMWINASWHNERRVRVTASNAKSVYACNIESRYPNLLNVDKWAVSRYGCISWWDSIWSHIWYKGFVEIKCPMPLKAIDPNKFDECLIVKRLAALRSCKQPTPTTIKKQTTPTTIKCNYRWQCAHCSGVILPCGHRMDCIMKAWYIMSNLSMICFPSSDNFTECTYAQSTSWLYCQGDWL